MNNMKKTLTLTTLLLAFGLNASAEITPPYYYDLKPSEKTITYYEKKPAIESIAYGKEDGNKWAAKFVVRYRICGKDDLRKYEVIDLENKKVYRDNNLDGRFDEIDQIKDLNVDFKKLPKC